MSFYFHEWPGWKDLGLVTGAFSYIYSVAEIASYLSRIYSPFFLTNTVPILLVMKFSVKHYTSQPPFQLGWPCDTVQANKVWTEVVNLLAENFPKREANSTGRQASPVCPWPSFLAWKMELLQTSPGPEVRDCTLMMADQKVRKNLRPDDIAELQRQPWTAHFWTPHPPWGKNKP